MLLPSPSSSPSGDSPMTDGEAAEASAAAATAATTTSSAAVGAIGSRGTSLDTWRDAVCPMERTEGTYVDGGMIVRFFPGARVEN